MMQLKTMLLEGTPEARSGIEGGAPIRVEFQLHQAFEKGEEMSNLITVMGAENS
jgi:hypothetical protein